MTRLTDWPNDKPGQTVTQFIGEEGPIGGPIGQWQTDDEPSEKPDRPRRTQLIGQCDRKPMRTDRQTGNWQWPSDPGQASGPDPDDDRPRPSPARTGQTDGYWPRPSYWPSYWTQPDGQYWKLVRRMTINELKDKASWSKRIDGSEWPSQWPSDENDRMTNQWQTDDQTKDNPMTRPDRQPARQTKWPRRRRWLVDSQPTNDEPDHETNWLMIGPMTNERQLIEETQLDSRQPRLIQPSIDPVAQYYWWRDPMTVKTLIDWPGRMTRPRPMTDRPIGKAQWKPNPGQTKIERCES